MLLFRKIDEKINKQFNKFVLPSIGAMWFFSLYTMVDGAFVGHGVGANALSAVNISMPYISLLFGLGILLSVGSSSIVSYYLGRRDHNNANMQFTQSVVSVLVIGSFIALLAFLNLPRMIHFLGARGPIADYAYGYLKIIVPFSPFFMVAYNLEILVKADGNPHLTMVFGLIAAGSNILMDYIFVYIFHWGIEGAAIATGISQLISTFGYLSHFYSKKSRLKFTKLTFSIKSFLAAVKLGIPGSLTEMSIGFTTFIYNYSIINHLGQDSIATYSVIMYINNLVINTMIAINQGAQPLVSYYYGGNDKKTLKDLAILVLRTAFVWGLIFFLLVFLFAKQIVLFFVSADLADLIIYSIDKLRIFGISFVITGLSIVTAGFMTATKNARYSFVISLLRGYILITTILLILPNIFGGQVIWMASIFNELVAVVIAFIFAYKVIWKKIFDCKEY